MNVILKNKINNLAKLFYSQMGYNQKNGYDFSNAGHPQEKSCWNMAIISYCFWNEDFKLLKYQVK